MRNTSPMDAKNNFHHTPPTRISEQFGLTLGKY